MANLREFILARREEKFAQEQREREKQRELQDNQLQEDKSFLPTLDEIGNLASSNARLTANVFSTAGEAVTNAVNSLRPSNPNHLANRVLDTLGEGVHGVGDFIRENIGDITSTENVEPARKSAVGSTFTDLQGGIATGVEGIGRFIGSDKSADNLQNVREKFYNPNRKAAPKLTDGLDAILDYATDRNGLWSNVANMGGTMLPGLVASAAMPEVAALKALGGLGKIGGDRLLAGLLGTGESALRRGAAKTLAKGLPDAVRYAMGSAPVESMIEGGFTIEDALKDGKSREQANAEGWKTFAGNLPLLTASNLAEGLMLGSPLARLAKNTSIPKRALSTAGQMAGRGVVGGVQQGTEEALQNAISKWAQGKDYSVNPANWDEEQNREFWEAFYSGGLLSGIAGVAHALNPDIAENDRQRGEDSNLSIKGYSDRYAEQEPERQDKKIAEKNRRRDIIGSYYDYQSDDNLVQWGKNISGGANENTIRKVIAAAKKHGVDPRLALSVATAESNINQDDISEVGAIGVMQLMPETAAELGVDPNNEDENIDGGIRYLKEMLDKTGDSRLATAAYNAGLGAVKEYGGIPPYGETQAYVDRIHSMYDNSPEYSETNQSNSTENIYTGENGKAEGKYWSRQTGDVSIEGLQPQGLNAIDMLGKWFYEKTGKPLILTSGTDGKHADGDHSHAKGWKFDVNDWDGNSDGYLVTADGSKGTLTDEFIAYGRSLGLGMNWEGDHVDVALDGDQWDGNGENAGGFNPSNNHTPAVQSDSKNISNSVEESDEDDSEEKVYNKIDTENDNNSGIDFEDNFFGENEKLTKFLLNDFVLNKLENADDAGFNFFSKITDDNNQFVDNEENRKILRDEFGDELREFLETQGNRQKKSVPVQQAEETPQISQTNTKTPEVKINTPNLDNIKANRFDLVSKVRQVGRYASENNNFELMNAARKAEQSGDVNLMNKIVRENPIPAEFINSEESAESNETEVTSDKPQIKDGEKIKDKDLKLATAEVSDDKKSRAAQGKAILRIAKAYGVELEDYETNSLLKGSKKIFPVIQNKFKSLGIFTSDEKATPEVENDSSKFKRLSNSYIQSQKNLDTLHGKVEEILREGDTKQSQQALDDWGNALQKHRQLGEELRGQSQIFVPESRRTRTKQSNFLSQLESELAELREQQSIEKEIGLEAIDSGNEQTRLTATDNYKKLGKQIKAKQAEIDEYKKSPEYVNDLLNERAKLAEFQTEGKTNPRITAIDKELARLQSDRGGKIKSQRGQIQNTRRNIADSFEGMITDRVRQQKNRIEQTKKIQETLSLDEGTGEIGHSLSQNEKNYFDDYEQSLSDRRAVEEKARIHAKRVQEQEKANRILNNLFENENSVDIDENYQKKSQGGIESYDDYEQFQKDKRIAQIRQQQAEERKKTTAEYAKLTSNLSEGDTSIYDEEEQETPTIDYYDDYTESLKDRRSRQKFEEKISDFSDRDKKILQNAMSTIEEPISNKKSDRQKQGKAISIIADKLKVDLPESLSQAMESGNKKALENGRELLEKSEILPTSKPLDISESKKTYHFDGTKQTNTQPQEIEVAEKTPIQEEKIETPTEKPAETILDKLTVDDSLKEIAIPYQEFLDGKIAPHNAYEKIEEFEETAKQSKSLSEDDLSKISEYANNLKSKLVDATHEKDISETETSKSAQQSKTSTPTESAENISEVTKEKTAEEKSQSEQDDKGNSEELSDSKTEFQSNDPAMIKTVLNAPVGTKIEFKSNYGGNSYYEITERGDRKMLTLLDEDGKRTNRQSLILNRENVKKYLGGKKLSKDSEMLNTGTVRLTYPENVSEESFSVTGNPDVTITDDMIVADKDLTSQQKKWTELGNDIGLVIKFFNGDKNFGGVYQGDVSYLNADGDFEQTFWHEAMHYLGHNNPEMLDNVLDAVNFTNEQLNKKRNSAEVYEDLSDREIAEELLADNMEGIVDRGRLLQQIAKQDKPLLQRLVSWLKSWFDKIKSYFKNPEGGLTRTQFNSIYNAFTDNLKNLTGTNGRPIFKVGRDSEIIKTTDGKELSTVTFQRKTSVTKYSVNPRDDSDDSFYTHIKSKAMAYWTDKPLSDRHKKAVTQLLTNLTGYKILYTHFAEKVPAIVNEANKVIRVQGAYKFSELLKEIGKIVAKDLKLPTSKRMSNYIADWLYTGALNDDSAEAKAFQKAMRDNPDQYKIMKEIQEKFLEYNDLEPMEKLKRSIHRKPGDHKSLKEKFDTYYTQVVDDLDPIKVLKTELEKISGEKFTTEEDIYKASRLVKGLSGGITELLLAPENEEQWTKAKEQLLANYPNLVGYDGIDLDRLKSFKMIADKVRAKGGNLEECERFCLACLEKEMHQKGFSDTILDESECDKIIDQYGELYEEAQKDIVNFSNVVLAMKCDAGVISRKTFDNAVKNWKNYIPTVRIFDEAETFTVADSLKHKKGSERDVVSPFEVILKNTTNFIAQAERNKVKLQIAQNARCGAYGKWISETDFINGNEPTITFLENGKRQYLATTEEVAKAVDSLNGDRQQANFFFATLNAITSFIRLNATQLNTDFAISNPIRDTQEAYLYTKNGSRNPVAFLVLMPLKVIQNLVGAIAHIAGVSKNKRWNRLREDPYYYEWVGHGGNLAAMVAQDMNKAENFIDDLTKTTEEKWWGRKNDNLWSKVLSPFKQILKGLQEFSEISENSIRLEVYKNVREMLAAQKADGKVTSDDMAESALRSRDATIDFARAGSKGRIFNRYSAFLNATIQSWDKDLKILAKFANPENWQTENGRKKLADIALRIALGTISLAFIQSIAIWTMSDDDRDLYEHSINDWQKDSNWFFPFLGVPIKIPKSYGLINRLVGTISEDIFNTILNDMPVNNRRYKNVIADALPSLLPTAFVPIFEVMSNYSTFYKGPLVPQKEQRLPAHMQYGNKTTEVAKQLGNNPFATQMSELFFGDSEGFSPRKIDHLIQSYAGFIGKTLTGAYGTALDEFPIVRRFTFDPYKNPQVVIDYYNERSKQERLFNEYKENFKQHKNIKPKGFDEQLYKRIKAKEKILKALSEKERKLLENVNIPASELKERLRELEVKRKEICKSALGR